MGAKEGFHKNVEPNNPHYNKDSKVMAKWTMSIYWGTDDSRCMSGTVNEYCYDFSNGKSVMTVDDDYAYSKEDFWIEDAMREVVDPMSSDDESDDDEEDEESADDDEEDEDEEE